MYFQRCNAQPDLSSYYCEIPLFIYLPKLQIYFAGYLWPSYAVLLLVATVADKKKEFAKNTRKKVEVWREVAEIMEKHSHPVNGEMCDKKMRSLKQRQVKINQVP